MPAHNWKSIDDGVFHHLHQAWVLRLSDRLNGGLLPDRFYALAEQRAGAIGPDVSTLEIDSLESEDSGGATTVLAPPKAAMKHTFDVLAYVNRQNTLVIRQTSSKKVVAVLEIVSRGNKTGKANFEAFMKKAHSCLGHGIHFTYVDLHSPTALAPYGVHGALRIENGDDPLDVPPGKELSAAGYEAVPIVNAYVNPFGVGDSIPATPLFLPSNAYVMLPLEETYSAAFASLPSHLRRTIEANAA